MKCMQTDFGGCDLSCFGDIAHFSFAFKTAKLFLPTMDYSPWGSKNRISSKKFRQVGVDVKCMQTNFGGCDPSSFIDFVHFSFAKISLPTMDYSPWGSKNRIGSKNSCK